MASTLRMAFAALSPGLPGRGMVCRWLGRFALAVHEGVAPGTLPHSMVVFKVETHGLSQSPHPICNFCKEAPPLANRRPKNMGEFSKTLFRLTPLRNDPHAEWPWKLLRGVVDGRSVDSPRSGRSRQPAPGNTDPEALSTAPAKPPDLNPAEPPHAKGLAEKNVGVDMGRDPNVSINLIT
jgi:hypothetical protein